MAGRPAKTILLIENDIEDARRIQGMFNESIACFFEVTHVESMSAAERYLAKQPVDIVLLDMGMTDPPGLEAVRQLRAVAPRVSIVLLSSAKDEGIAVLALQDGAQDYLIKGQIEPRELMRALLNSAERKMIEEVLFVEKERAQVTLNSIGDAVICTDTEGIVTFLNPVAERMSGWMLKDAVGRPMTDTFQIVNATNRKALLDPMAKATSKNRTGKIPLNSVLIRRDGNEVFIEDSVAPIRDREGRVTGAVIVFRDVTATRTLEEKLTYSAHHDFLTGLPNRMLLSARVAQAISHARRTKGRVAVLFLDLDGFKEINDSLGHLIGDKLLQSAAKRLLSCVRGPDTVSRQGGDEFVVLLRELQNPEDAAATARRLLNAVADVHSIDQHQIRVTTSIGLSIYPNDAKDAENLIRKADIAMYHAKKNGRHIYEFFKPEMTIDPIDVRSVERDLRHAKDLEIELQSKGSPVHAHGRTMLSGIRQTATLNAGKHKGIRQKSRRAGTEEG